jgi:hypothetical protein
LPAGNNPAQYRRRHSAEEARGGVLPGAAAANVALSALHAQILDLPNENGVQTVTPNYEADPAAPKVVPKTDWFAAPDRPESTEG